MSLIEKFEVKFLSELPAEIRFNLAMELINSIQGSAVGLEKDKDGQYIVYTGLAEDSDTGEFVSVDSPDYIPET
jgi:hypothetical protein